MKTVVGTMQVKEIADVLNNVGAGMSTETYINGNAATLTLKAEDSGKTVLFNKADGCIVTLPASTPGLKFKFKVLVSVTSGAYGIYGAATSDLFMGGIISEDTDAANALVGFAPDVSDDDRMAMNGTTTGGLIGSWFEVECIAAARWHIRGVNKGSGSVATPFA